MIVIALVLGVAAIPLLSIDEGVRRLTREDLMGCFAARGWPQISISQDKVAFGPLPPAPYRPMHDKLNHGAAVVPGARPLASEGGNRFAPAPEAHLWLMEQPEAGPATRADHPARAQLLALDDVLFMRTPCPDS